MWCFIYCFVRMCPRGRRFIAEMCRGGSYLWISYNFIVCGLLWQINDCQSVCAKVETGHTRTHTRKKRMHAHAHTTLARTITHTSTRTHKQARARTAHTRAHIYAHARARTHTKKHTNTHTHITPKWWYQKLTSEHLERQDTKMEAVKVKVRK